MVVDLGFCFVKKVLSFFFTGMLEELLDNQDSLLSHLSTCVRIVFMYIHEEVNTNNTKCERPRD